MQTTANPTTIALFVIPVFLVAFVGLWLFIITILRYVSGWAALAKQYEFSGTFEGQSWKWQSGMMRRTNFNNCLTIGSSFRGLYLALIAPLRFKSPPLLVPWSEITISRRKFFLVEAVCLELGRELKIPLCIRASLAENLQRSAGASWPAQSADLSVNPVQG